MADAAETCPSEIAIVDAARGVFARDGYNGARWEDLAGAAGLSCEDLSARFADREALFKAAFIRLEQDFDTHCREAAEAAFGEPIDIFLAGCRAALDFVARPDFVRIALVEAPAVLGDAEWARIDHGMGVPAVTGALKMIAPASTAPSRRAMASMIVGASNEMIRGLARGDEGLTAEACLGELERLIRAWAHRGRG